MENEKKEIKSNEKSYLKEAYLKSKKYKDKKDLINTLLEDSKSYTENQVNKIIDNYLKRKVM